VRIRYTPRSFRELGEIFATIDERSPIGARNVKARIYATIRFIASYPYAGALTTNRRLRRIAAHPYPYLIFYRIAASEIITHGIRHGARNPSSMPR
jgi:plasmid stabilization system protein ParE